MSREHIEGLLRYNVMPVHKIHKRLLYAQLMAGSLAGMVLVLVGLLAMQRMAWTWVAAAAIALALDVLYGYLGLVLVQNTHRLSMLVIRHVSRTLFVGMLLVLLPLYVLGGVSAITIGVFFTVHWLSWWWVFGRRNASRHLH